MIQEEHALGHFGRDQIFRKIWDKGYWWPEMRKQIQQEVMKCDSCARFVVHKEGFKPAEFITADGPWHHVQIDCQTNLPRSPEGYTTLLSIVDVFSGFCLLYPLPSHTAEAVAQKLWLAFSTFGFPRILQSDNGTEFANKVVKALVDAAQMDHRFIAAYNPRTDGKVERTFGIVNEITKKLLQGADKFWPLFIPLAQLYINNHVSALTKSTPMSLMFNREAQIPSAFRSAVEAQQAPEHVRSVDDWQRFQQRVLSVIFPAISSRIVQTKVRMTSKLNQQRRAVPADAFRDGSLVMIKDPAYLGKNPRKGKRDATYIGPYRILRKDRNGNFVLQDTDGNELQRRVPPDQLKEHSSPNGQAEQDIYEVESVVDHRGEPGHFEYRVKWKGSPSSENTWEPAHNFIDTQCIRDYWKRVDDQR